MAEKEKATRGKNISVMGYDGVYVNIWLIAGLMRSSRNVLPALGDLKIFSNIT